MLDDYLRYLRNDVADVFVRGLANNLILQQMELTMEQLNQLIEINEALLAAGEIGEIDLLKTRLEARNFETEMFDLKTEYNEIMSEFYYLIGGIVADSIVFAGNLDIAPPALSFESLKSMAKNNRSDIIAFNHIINAAEYEMRLARSERFPDISIIAGYHNEEAIRPMPGLNYAYAGVVIPLKFSGFNRGEYAQSMYRLEQTKIASQALHLQIDTDLKRSYQNFRIMLQKRMMFTQSILEDSERVRDAVLFSYQRGEVSLLEVLEAQRTMNEIYMNYYQTLTDYSFSLIELSKNSGNWLVEF